MARWREIDNTPQPLKMKRVSGRQNRSARQFTANPAICCRRAGLRDIRFHDLRHTCAALMLAVGTNPKVVQETLGHADISVTLDIYSHLLPNMQEEVAQKINELLC
jgi:integrase